MAQFGITWACMVYVNLAIDSHHGAEAFHSPMKHQCLSIIYTCVGDIFSRKSRYQSHTLFSFVVTRSIFLTSSSVLLCCVFSTLV